MGILIWLQYTELKQSQRTVSLLPPLRDVGKQDPSEREGDPQTTATNLSISGFTTGLARLGRQDKGRGHHPLLSHFVE